MKFSESWLREWVKPAINSEELAHQITMAGLEVDEVAPVAGEFTGVKVGKVVECGQHPDADKLQVTKIDIGEADLLDIVCGAANCRLGLTVAVATVGAVLPGNFKIKKAKLRGQPSHGMLCSFSELGIDVESDGILELPEGSTLGMDVRDLLELNDVAIDVDLTANRADCFSIRGLAREVGVLNRADVTEPSIEAVATSIEDTVSIDVKAAEACPRYLGRVIKNVNAKAETPIWMQEKLRRCGIRSIDAIVDITNYVMLEQGQPMHAFDLSKIDGGIVVRMAEQDEKLTLLDGNEAKLNNNTLVIADQNKALAIAGIFGGKESGVTTETTDIMLECAFFAPDHIRGRARAYGLHTDSSLRFERGVDSTLQVTAMERATQLLVELCGGEVAPISAAESEADLPTANTVELRRSKLDGLLGHHIPSTDVVEILTRLGCAVSIVEDSATTDAGWTATSPSWRFDIAIEQDLIEEVGRIYGYNNIPNQAPVAALSMNVHKEANQPLKRVRDLLVDRGYHEAITYSFVEPEQQKLIVPEIEPLILPFPISADMSAMRLSLWTGLINTVVHNQKRQQPRVRLFESGLRFIPEESAENGMRQEMMLAGIIAGTRGEEHWDIATNTVDFYDLKGDLEAVLELTANELAYEFKAAKHPALHPGQTAAIVVGGKEVGFIGTVHPELERKFGLNGRTIMFEIEWDAINTRAIPEAVALSKFPANRRDIAVVVSESIQSGDIVNECLASGGELLTAAKLFDVYQGQGVEAGKKSLAITLTLQSTERTLEDADISAAVDSIVASIGEKFGASLRD